MRKNMIDRDLENGTFEAKRVPYERSENWQVVLHNVSGVAESFHETLAVINPTSTFIIARNGLANPGSSNTPKQNIIYAATPNEFPNF